MELKAAIADSESNARPGLMQRKTFLKEQNGAFQNPWASTPSSALDTAVVVIDNMTEGESIHRSPQA